MKKVFVYSIGAFEQLPEDFKQGKAIIRIHNCKNKMWYEDIKGKNTIWLFFDDIHLGSLSLFEKIKTIYFGMDSSLFSVSQARQVQQFIKQNEGNDFIIHCEYGRSRSVAVAMFLRDKHGYVLANKTEEELKRANTLVTLLLNRTS